MTINQSIKSIISPALAVIFILWFVSETIKQSMMCNETYIPKESISLFEKCNNGSRMEIQSDDSIICRCKDTK
jgi:hypothetical protein